jgi:hypothetical protein
MVVVTGIHKKTTADLLKTLDIQLHVQDLVIVIRSQIVSFVLARTAFGATEINNAVQL